MNLNLLEMQKLKDRLFEHLKSGETNVSLEAARYLIDIAAMSTC